MNLSSFVAPNASTRRRLSCLTAAAVTLLLAGCVTTPPAGLHVEAPLAAQEGAFLVRVVPNAPSAGIYFKNWAGLFIVAVNPDGSDGATYQVPASLDASSRSALFVASMPPGRYRLGRLSSASYGMVQKSQWIEVGARFPHFEIQAGRLTDLGAIVQTMAPGSSRNVELGYDANPDHEIAGDLVRELAPRFAPLLGKPWLGWSSDSTRADARSTGGIASYVSVGIVDPQVLADGRLVAGSYDGMVKAGVPDRPAQLHDVGQRVSIEAVAVLPDASWVAAGEYGVIRQSNDGGATWRSIRGDLPYGLVCSVHAVSGQLVATVLRGDRVVVASTTPGSASAPHWTVHASYTPSSEPFWQWKSRYATHSFVVDGQIVTAMPSNFIGVWDPRTGQSFERKLPDTVDSFAAPGGDALRFMSPAGLFANNSYLSNDVGATWEKLPTLPFVEAVALSDKLNGVGWAPGLQIRTGSFLKTADGGRTWTKLGEQGLIVPQVILDKVRGVAYAIDIQGSLWVGTNGASDWARTNF